MNRLIEFLLIWFIVTTLTMGVVYIITSYRKGASAVRSKPHRLLTMVTASSVDETIRAVLKCAYRFSYSIDDINEKAGRIVLSDSATVTSFGFFYPVYISSNAEGQTVIDVGAQSKWYFVVDCAIAPARARCFNAIKATVLFD